MLALLQQGKLDDARFLHRRLQAPADAQLNAAWEAVCHAWRRDLGACVLALRSFAWTGSAASVALAAAEAVQARALAAVERSYASISAERASQLLGAPVSDVGTLLARVCMMPDASASGSLYVAVPAAAASGDSSARSSAHAASSSAERLASLSTLTSFVVALES